MASLANFSELTEPDDGGNNDAWGPLLLAILEAFDRALAGQASASLAGGDLTLDTTQGQTGVIKLTGSLSANRAVNFASGKKRRFVLWNTTSGNFTVTAQVTGGAGLKVVVPQGSAQILWCDGTDVIANGMPVAPGGGAPDTARVGSPSFSGPGMFFGADPLVGLTRRGSGIMGVGLNQAALGDLLRFNDDNTATGPLLGLGTGSQSDGFGTGFYRIPPSSGVNNALAFAVNGSYAARMELGLVVGDPTGGGKGVGSINATDYFANGVRVPARYKLFTGLSADANSAAQAAHSCGNRPILAQASLRCISGDIGFSSGMELSLAGLYGVAVGFNDTQYVYQVAVTGIEVPNFASGAIQQITNGRWKIDLKLFY